MSLSGSHFCGIRFYKSCGIAYVTAKHQIRPVKLNYVSFIFNILNWWKKLNVRKVEIYSLPVYSFNVWEKCLGERFIMEEVVIDKCLL